MNQLLKITGIITLCLALLFTTLVGWAYYRTHSVKSHTKQNLQAGKRH